jgi:pimeloyl-ACP methyl ester carboxylesterase
MDNFRIYGNPPFGVAVIHGGPGAPGEMAPVARKLSSFRGILEPLQTADSIDGQVEELHGVLQEHGDPPMILIGHSWGAWLSFIFTAEYPAFVRKLILVSSGPFEEKYAAGIMKTRLGRLSAQERTEVGSLIKSLNNPGFADRDAAIARFGSIISKADSCGPLPDKNESLDVRYDIYDRVWRQASELRKSSRLLQFGRKINCPVVAIHGDYDPHPAEGVKDPLSRVLRDFRFILLKNCGHKPWMEKAVRDEFYRIIRCEIE